jgi:hypothetical protein
MLETAHMQCNSISIIVYMELSLPYGICNSQSKSRCLYISGNDTNESVIFCTLVVEN